MGETLVPSILIISGSGTPALTDRRLLPARVRVSCCRYPGPRSDALPGVAAVILEVDRGNGEAALQFLRLNRYATTRILLLVRDSSEKFAIDALNAGATRYLTSCSSDVDFRQALEAVMTLPSTESVRERESECVSAERFVGDSAPMRELRGFIARVAKSPSNVLITGETGTGKELVAELLHANSLRCDRPFVCLNTTAIPDALIESELFGYERGAFTGAYTANGGKLAAGNHGTVFFDEIGDISPPLQAKLLRALDGKLIHRLGGNKPVPLDIRVIAATNQTLESAVEDRRFRSDLYYRLNVVRIELPPLRERPEDIIALLRHYVAIFNRSFGASVEGFTDDATRQLVSYDWPGNVRELKNVVEATFANLPDATTRVLSLPPRFLKQSTESPDKERAQIVNALMSNNWNKSKAANQLHWSRMTLYRKLSRLKIAPPGVVRPVCPRT